MSDFLLNVYNFAKDGIETITFMLDDKEQYNIHIKYYDWIAELEHRLRPSGPDNPYESTYETLLIIIQFCYRMEFDYYTMTDSKIAQIIDLSDELFKKWYANKNISRKDFVENRIMKVFSEETVRKVTNSVYDYNTDYMKENPFCYTLTYADNLSNKEYLENREMDIVYNIYKLGHMIDDCDEDDPDYKELVKKLDETKELYNLAKEVYREIDDIISDDDLSIIEKGKLLQRKGDAKYSKVYGKLIFFNKM